MTAIRSSGRPSSGSARTKAAASAAADENKATPARRNLPIRSDSLETRSPMRTDSAATASSPMGERNRTKVSRSTAAWQRPS